MADDKLEQVIIRMPSTMRQEIKDAAKRNDLTISQVVRAAVRGYLAEQREVATA